MRVSVVILGGGGHARVLADALALDEGVAVAGVLDADPARRGSHVGPYEVVGDDSCVPALMERGVTHFVNGVGSVADAARRRRVFERATASGLLPLSVVHPTAFVAASARLAGGCVVLTRAVVGSGAIVSENVIVNTGAIVEHDCRIGPHAHIATGAMLGGDVTVGEESHVGIGATIRQGIHVGRRAVVGAGAVVVKDVPDNTVVVGVPAAPASPG